jgi:hypothetical protein
MIRIVIAAALGFAITLPAISAQAQVNRTFVSAAGSDSNNCANVLTPCRHFAAAYAVTAPSGEIFVLDPANYGSLTITHAVSIEGHGWASIAPPNNGNAITINAGSSESISIQGVAMDGTGATGGTSGIVFNSGGSLTVNNWVLQNFSFSSGAPNTSGHGIFMQPSSGSIKFAITNTTMANNDRTGFFYFPPNGSTATVSGLFDRVTATNNGSTGIVFNTNSGGAATTVAITNSTSSTNATGIALVTGSAPITGSIDNTATNSNAVDGILVQGAANVTLSRSIVTANGNNGVRDATSGHTFYTFGNNQIGLNNTDGFSALNNSVYSLH